MPALAKSRARTPARPVNLRERIREAARELFAREGFESVSCGGIGAKAGCSAMAMYRHFENKEELLVFHLRRDVFGDGPAHRCGARKARHAPRKSCGAAFAPSSIFI